MASAAGAGLGILGTVAQTAGDVMASDVQAKSLDAEARSVQAQAQFDETQTRRRNALMLGDANKQTAASGVSMSSGSPLLHELDRIKQSEIEALNIRRQGQNAVASLNFQRRLVRRQIPFQIAGGVAQSGSILSRFAGRGGFSGGSGSGAAKSNESSSLNNWYGGGGYGTAR
jgi:hypothetical protein